MARTILNIPSGTTETVAAGETQPTATVTNAGTFENAGTNTAGGLELQTQSVDVDAATLTLTRLRNLTTVGLPTLVVATGETETIASGTTETTGNVENAGTVSNAGTLQAGGVEENLTVDVDNGTSTLTAVIPDIKLKGSATDIDAANVSITRVRDLLATGSDPDVATTPLTRIRELFATADNIDTSTATTTRVRDLLGEAADVDVATNALAVAVQLSGDATDVDGAEINILELIVPETTAIPRTQPVETITDVLERTEGVWRAEEPIVKNYWDEAQSERGQAADQPPRLYVWQPASESHDKFSLDGDTSDDAVTIEVLIYSLDEIEAKRYAADVRGILQLYINDNKDVTQYTDIKPVATNDYRQQSNHRATDQYVLSVEIDMRTLQETGDLG
ncbi:hypothetical protein OSG_eHP34_00095 [environmental Halophage eHP-34]|nr:hypothetical protein OSG_eHP34_00095 [environmental Halophage eHP-34]